MFGIKKGRLDFKIPSAELQPLLDVSWGYIQVYVSVRGPYSFMAHVCLPRDRMAAMNLNDCFDYSIFFVHASITYTLMHTSV